MAVRDLERVPAPAGAQADGELPAARWNDLRPIDAEARHPAFESILDERRRDLAAHGRGQGLDLVHAAAELGKEAPLARDDLENPPRGPRDLRVGLAASFFRREGHAIL